MNLKIGDTIIVAQTEFSFINEEDNLFSKEGVVIDYSKNNSQNVIVRLLLDKKNQLTRELPSCCLELVDHTDGKFAKAKQS